jgi:phage terminase large subunit
MNLKLTVTPVYLRNYRSKARIVCNQGGTRSSKTYSVLQAFITKAYENTGKIYSIVRKSFNTLKTTAMRDYFDILKEYDLYREANHNKTDNTYLLNGNLFEFQGLDQPSKKRGAKRDYLFINEATELTLEDWRQLIYRTSKQIFLDYNPSYEFHWIYDHVIPRDDCEFIQSTYRDAYEFLPKELIEEIERIQASDENHWRIYGLGERGKSTIRVYNDYRLIPGSEYPENYDEIIYGLDFGYNNPTVLIGYGFKDQNIYADEIIYQTKITNTDLIHLLRDRGINRTAPIYADSAEPNRIEEIRQAGYNVHPANKDVSAGLDYVKSLIIHSKHNNTNLNNERRMYSYKVDKDGNILDDVVKFKDHAMDAERYALFTHTAGVKATIGGSLVTL